MSLQIKQLRKIKNFTQADVARKIGITPSAVAMYERGEREPSIETLDKLCELFEIDMDTLVGRPSSKSHTFISYGPDGDRPRLREDIARQLAPKAVKIPVLGYVAAGIPIETITDILDYEEIDPDMVKDGSEYFALKIKGQSMEPKISDGDVVIVRRQHNIDNGQIAIVCVNGDQATCKKVVKQENGILLVPFNPAFETAFYTNEQIESIPITILGRVVELRAKF